MGEPIRVNYNVIELLVFPSCVELLSAGKNVFFPCTVFGANYSCVNLQEMALTLVIFGESDLQGEFHGG